MKISLYWLLCACIIVSTFSCTETDVCVSDPQLCDTLQCGEDLVINYDTLTHAPTPYDLVLPQFLDPNTFVNPPNNPLTNEGVALGRLLFHDPILSLDTSLACASCHAANFGFTDNGNALSAGVTGELGTRNAMPLMNLAWAPRLFWDGRSATLEEQALEPVPNPLEMHLIWDDAICRLMNTTDYRIKFYEAFGVEYINRQDVANALAQFERTMISGNALYDKLIDPSSGISVSDLPNSALVEQGYTLFTSEAGDCFHCHGDANTGYQFTDYSYHNNGLDAAATVDDFVDKGLGDVTGNPNDNGLFKTPSLRNVALTAPYMHDGRFATLEEVIDHYSSNVKVSPTIAPIILADFEPTGEGTRGKNFSPQEKAALIAFLETLTDTAFVNNPAFSAP